MGWPVLLGKNQMSQWKRRLSHPNPLQNTPDPSGWKKKALLSLMYDICINPVNLKGKLKNYPLTRECSTLHSVCSPLRCLLSFLSRWKGARLVLSRAQSPYLAFPEEHYGSSPENFNNALDPACIFPYISFSSFRKHLLTVTHLWMRANHDSHQGFCTEMLSILFFVDALVIQLGVLNTSRKFISSSINKCSQNNFHHPAWSSLRPCLYFTIHVFKETAEGTI